MVKNTVVDGMDSIEVFNPQETYTLAKVAERLSVSPYVVRAARLSGALATINLGGSGRGADYRVIGVDANRWLSTLRCDSTTRGSRK